MSGRQITCGAGARHFNRPTFALTRHTDHRENASFRDFSNIWRGCIFFLLTFALLHLLSADLTTLLCFSTVHIVGSFYLNFLRLLQYTPYVLQRTTPVLFRTTVLQSITPTLLCTTKFYSNRNDVRTTSIQYYSVLQSTTPVLLRTTKYYSTACYKRTTKYYSSTTPYYTRITKYFSVLRTSKYYSALLQSTIPVLFHTTPYYSVLQSTSPTDTTSERRPSSTDYSSTTVQSTTPVLLRTTKYYSSTSP